MKVNTNCVIITGNLARDSELRFTANQKPVLSFTVACNRSWKDDNGELRDAADFFPVVLWGKSAEALEQYLKKGKSVLVKGHLQTRSYEGRDGVKKYVTEIIADMFGGVELLGGGSQDRSGGSQPQSYRQPAQKQRNDFAPQDDYSVFSVSDLGPTSATPPGAGDNIPF